MSRGTDAAAPKIRTMGQAEEIGYKLMMVGGGIMGVGLLLCLTVLFVGLGVPLLILGGLIVLADIAWMFRVMRRPSEEVRCPYCHKQNVVLVGVPSFACDDCHHVIEPYASRATAEAPAAH
jgi:hypothetical protein